MLSKAGAKDRVVFYKNSMQHFIGLPVIVSLGPHKFSMVVSDVLLATLTELSLTPDKSLNLDTGKMYTPQVMQLRFQTGEAINLVIEDITDFSVGVREILFKLADEELRISYDRTNLS